MVTKTLYPDKDAQVRESNPTANYGSTEYISVAQANATNEIRRALLEFDLSGLPDVPIDFISSCVLNVYDSGSIDPRTIDFRRIEVDTWTESGVTWNNQPASTDFNVEDNWSTGWNDRSVISLLRSALRDGDSFLGILLKYTNESYDGSFDGNELRSKESSYDPYLTVNYSTYSQTRLKGSLCKNYLDLDGWGEITMTDHNCPTGDAAEFTFKTQWGSTYTEVYLDVGETVEYTSGTKHHSFKLYSMSCNSAPCDNLAAATIEEKFWDTGNAYVKIGGDNDRHGRSWTEAWETITHAANEVFDGQDVRIGFGTYDSETDITPDNAGSTGIKYTPETAGTGGGTGLVTVNM